MVINKSLKITALFFMSLVIFILSISLNIVAHEVGHYLVAEAFGLNPEIHINSPSNYAKNFFSMDSEIAYVSYDARSSSLEVPSKVP